jgi:5-methylcytosine-specific restriction endonuclease McrA
LNSCKSCQDKYTQEWCEKNRERRREIARDWHYRRGGSPRLVRTEEEKKEIKRAGDRRYYEAHREKIKQKVAAWYRANREAVLQRTDNWRKQNVQIIAVRNSTYGKTHRKQRLITEYRRRAKKRGNGGSFTPQEWNDLCHKHGNKCLMCGRSDVILTVDHVIPISWGGSNLIENIQPLCRSCNCSKGARFMDLRKVIDQA